MDEKILELLRALEQQGKAPEEIALWEDLLPIMTDAEKSELSSSLEKELGLIAKLKKTKNSPLPA